MEFYAIFNFPGTLRWNALIDRIGLLLVTAGVAGELAIEHKTHRAERKLRGINIEIEREMDITLTAADERIEQLRKENNETALVLKDRSLGNMLEFQQAMWAFRGTEYVLETGVDRESLSFKIRLNAALLGSEWKTHGHVLRRLNLGEGVWILTVGTKSDTRLSEAGEALADWLNNHNVVTLTNVTERDGLSPGTVLIQIGTRPETFERFEEFRAARDKEKRERSGDRA